MSLRAEPGLVADLAAGAPSVVLLRCGRRARITIPRRETDCDWLNTAGLEFTQAPKNLTLPSHGRLDQVQHFRPPGFPEQPHKAEFSAQKILFRGHVQRFVARYFLMQALLFAFCCGFLLSAGCESFLKHPDAPAFDGYTNRRFGRFRHPARHHIAIRIRIPRHQRFRTGEDADCVRRSERSGGPHHSALARRNSGNSRADGEDRTHRRNDHARGSAPIASYQGARSSDGAAENSRR